MYTHGEKSQAFFDRAKAVMPNGVSSNYRYISDEETLVVADAKGGHIFDFDGKEFIDYRLGWGPVIIGHADEFVNARVKEAIDHGVTFAGTQKYEVSAAERVVAMCPGVELVRFVNSGTEATMHAIRLARGYTGRDIVLKFEGSYHGAHDHVLWSTFGANPDNAGDRIRPIAHKESLGIPEGLRGLIQIAPWNDVEVLGDILQEKGERIAAVIMEPYLGNANALTPQPGYLEFVREQCDKYGIVLIFDEVKTGFRVAPGGIREATGVIPDLSTYAKALGNGYPIAAIGGHRAIMSKLAPKKVFQGGTYSGNAVSTAAADATLELLQTGAFDQINKIGTAIMDGLGEICTRHSVPHFVNGTPGMFGICFSETRPRDWRELLTKCNWDLSASVYGHLADNGVMPEPGGTEPFFICASHTEADVEKTLHYFEEGLRLALA